MRTERITITVSSSIGQVSGCWVRPGDACCLMTLAHGAGAGMDHVFMETLAEALAGQGIATLRFNFPFAEHGRRRPDGAALAQLTIGAAVAKARELAPGLPLLLAGKSFGGRMSSHYLAATAGVDASGIVFFGFPLHPAGKPSGARAAHLHTIDVPMLFLQGSRDALASWELIEQTCSALPGATLVRFEGADHSFKAGRKVLVPELAAEAARWIRTILA